MKTVTGIPVNNVTKPQKTIMVVDDEEHLLELAKALFEAEGHRVITATNGYECLKILETTKPDLVLNDMLMPDMSGRELTERIRKNQDTKDVKVAFLSVVHVSELGRSVLKKLDVVDYITKPFDNEELVRRVNRILS
jgi:CheY-like chemotaxis protein